METLNALENGPPAYSEPALHDHTSARTVLDLHSGEFPTPQLPFESSLCRFDTVYSPWRQPLHWSWANRRSLDKLLQEVGTRVPRTGLKMMRMSEDNMIYPVRRISGCT